MIVKIRRAQLFIKQRIIKKDDELIGLDFKIECLLKRKEEEEVETSREAVSYVVEVIPG
jgi:hypothetical protein